MRRDQILKYMVLLLSVSSTALLLSSCAASSQPTASGALMDLRSWDFAQDGPVDLAGEWRIYWKQLISPEALADAAPSPDGLFFMPGTWNSWPNKSESVGGSGFATFTLELILPDEMESAALWVPNASTAYSLWVDGTNIAACGTVGTDEGSSIPHYRMRIATFPVADHRVSLLLQVSNFHHRRGGMWKSPPDRYWRTD